MKRLRDLLGRGSDSYLLEAVKRRKSYYANRFTSLFKRHKMVERYLKSSSRPRLHIGSGGNLLNGWLNSDILDLKPGMIFLDARERFPFETGSLNFVYSEHLLEHLSYPDGSTHLKECWRVLKPGGVLRISTPDLAFLTGFYENDTSENKEYLDWASNWYWNQPTHEKALVFNYYMTSWGHKFIYDYTLLKNTCETIGFRQVTKEEIGKSGFPELKNVESHGQVIGDKWNQKESMVIEAQK